MTTELAAVLSANGPVVTVAAVHEILTAHPALTPGAEDGFIVGRPASVPAIAGGPQPPGPATELVLGATGRMAISVSVQPPPQAAAR